MTVPAPMVDATICDATGRIRYPIRVLDAAELALNVPDGWGAIPGWHDGETHYGVLFTDEEGDFWLHQPRPEAGLPATHSIEAGVEWPVDDVPEGTVVTIDGAEAGTVDDGGLVLEFPLAATWRVDLLPPWPWRPATCIVEVAP